jgi:quinol monooxygenase YgiN
VNANSTPRAIGCAIGPAFTDRKRLVRLVHSPPDFWGSYAIPEVTTFRGLGPPPFAARWSAVRRWLYGLEISITSRKSTTHRGPALGTPSASGRRVVRLAVMLAPPACGTDQLVCALRFLASPTRVGPGCLGCRVWTEDGEESLVRYEEEWATEQAMRLRVRSERFTRLLRCWSLRLKHRASSSISLRERAASTMSRRCATERKVRRASKRAPERSCRAQGRMLTAALS